MATIVVKSLSLILGMKDSENVVDNIIDSFMGYLGKMKGKINAFKIHWSQVNQKEFYDKFSDYNAKIVMFCKMDNLD
jgi:hypothetical protein